VGDLISLAARRAARRSPLAGPATPGGPAARVTFFFDLSSPWTYLAAERAERMFAGVRWRPAAGEPFSGTRPRRDEAALRSAAERRAAELRMPLVWPEDWPAGSDVAMRVASLAASDGRAAQFVLAAGRLAFCGGFRLDDPEVLAEAAAAADLALDDALAAAGQKSRDIAMRRTSRALLRRGAEELPVILVDRLLFSGERRLADARAAAAALPLQRRRRPAEAT
jgi:2-hydroxychromene-2-carboxylate isomerase